MDLVQRKPYTCRLRVPLIYPSLFFPSYRALLRLLRGRRTGWRRWRCLAGTAAVIGRDLSYRYDFV